MIREARYHGSSRPIKRHLFDEDTDAKSAFSISESMTPLGGAEYYQWLQTAGKDIPTTVDMLTGVHASEYAFKDLSGQYNGAVNIATHAFSFNRDEKMLGKPYLMNQSLCLSLTHDVVLPPLFRCGLFLSGAERAFCGRNKIDGIEDGILNGAEIAALDLSGIDLITLMACSTGTGDIDVYEGAFGIRRALKRAGCGTVVSTAWNVDKEAAGVYLKEFYTHLFDHQGISEAHRKAQIELMKRFECPYYWAVFQLVD